MNRIYLTSLVVFAASCSSLVDDPCVAGYHMETNMCMPNVRLQTVDADANTSTDGNSSDGGDGDSGVSDGGIVIIYQDAQVQVLTCDLPTSKCGLDCVLLDTDPENCGHCGRVCASGICSTGTCVGDVSGHVVVIGHDYAASDPAMDRVIGNAVHLGTLSGSSPVRIGWWRGDSTLEGGKAAAARGLAQTGDSATSSTLATVDHNALLELDAVVIEPQMGDGAVAEQAGADAAPALAEFLTAGHSLVILETTSGVGYRYLLGAGLGTLPPPVNASSMAVTVVAAGDAIATGVVTPYLAKPGSVGYPGAAHAVVADGANDAVVIHSTY